MRRTAAAFMIAGIALSLARTSAAVVAGATFGVPDAIPEGWYVLGARGPVAQISPGRPYYARETSDGPALSAGTMSCDSGCDGLSGTQREVTGLEGEGGRLVRNGKWVWVIWASRDNYDLGYFVAARGLPDRAVVKAARATRVKDGTVAAIGRRGLPSGFRKVGTFDVAQWGIPFGAERVTLIRGDGRSPIDSYTYTYDSKAARAAQRFWSAQAPLMSRPPPTSDGLAETGQRTMLIESGDRAVVLIGAQDASVLRSLGRSFHDVDSAQWEAFRARVGELPVNALLPGYQTLNAPVVFDGFNEGARWAAVLSDDGTRTNVFVSVADPDTGLQKSSASLAADLASHGLCGTATRTRLGLVAAGVAPVATTHVRFDPEGTSPVEGMLGPTGPDPGQRYVAAFVPSYAAMLIPAIALDDSGTEIAHTQEFGNLTCP
jgi:hypothetical protein